MAPRNQTLHISLFPQNKGVLQLPHAVGRVSIDLWPQEAQHLPAFRLKLVGPPGVVDPLADGRMEFQSVGVDQDAPRREVGEVGARQ